MFTGARVMAVRLAGLVGLAVVVAWINLGPVGSVVAAAEQESEAFRRYQSAVATQEATRARLRVLNNGSRCADARFVSYRRSDAERDTVDEWYVASQLWADTILLGARGLAGLEGRNSSATAKRTGSTSPRTTADLTRVSNWSEPDARCHLNKGFVFLDRLWDDDNGGYFPLSNLAATRVERDVRYADDNALTGLALIAGAEAASGSQRKSYLQAARLEADFLTQSGLWDDTFGGGFWWNTNRGDSDEGKPAQTNAIAALFFARLFEETEDDGHREWALRTLLWLDSALFDDARNLYRWSARYEDPAGRAGNPILSDRYFNYDQGIAIEAQIWGWRLDGDGDRLSRARAVGQAAHAAFWNAERGGHNLEAGIDQVYTSYAAWTSLGHLALYDLDGQAGWLNMARSNADGLLAAVREQDGGYAFRHYRCVDRIAPGCGSGRVQWVVDRTRDTAAQAWMQHLQTAIAQRLATYRPAGGR